MSELNVPVLDSAHGDADGLDWHASPADRTQLQQLAKSLLIAQEEERRRIARELHDGAGQLLTALKMKLEMMCEDLDHLSGEMLHADLQAVIALTDQTQNSLRVLAQMLRPPGLEAVGLDVALENYCAEFAKSAGLLITYVGVELPRLDDLSAISLYRFAQETLAAVAQHAYANQVSVTLQFVDDILMLTIADDGRGFDPAELAPPSAFDLKKIRERFALFGGCVAVRIRPEQGTRITAFVPQRCAA